MSESFEARRGGAVLIKKGEQVPEDAVPLGDNDVLRIQMNRIDHHKPQSDVSVFTYGLVTLGATVGCTGLIMNNIFRRNFKLGGLRRMATYLPVVAVPAFVTSICHEFFVKQKILLGREQCPLCISLRSGVYQVSLGVGYPYLMSILTCLPVARQFYTLPLPAKGSGGGGLLTLLKRVSPTPTVILFLCATQMFVGMNLASSEYKAFINHLSKPPKSSEFPPDFQVDQ